VRAENKHVIAAVQSAAKIQNVLLLLLQEDANTRLAVTSGYPFCKFIFPCWTMNFKEKLNERIS
jgi:hypothetical protein